MSLDHRSLAMQVDNVASLPMIFVRINEAVNSPRSSMGEIARVISEDAGLSARLLRLANSAFYSFPSKIETITHALTIIGTRQMRDLALATSVMTVFKNIPKELLDMESFWRHSIACGVTARVLATHRRESNIERYFVAGVLHDIGRLMLCQNMPEMVEQALVRCRESSELLIDVEEDLIGIDHATLGGALLRQWKLPSSLEEMVTYHHRPMTAARFPNGVALMHLADVVTHVAQLGNSGERFIPPLNHDAWTRLGLATSSLSLVMDQVEQQYDSAVQIILNAEND